MTQLISDRKFGIEIETFSTNGVRRDGVASALRNAGINALESGYTHTTTSHWKVLYDSSVSGYSIEIVSPILKGQAGLDELETVCGVLEGLGLKVNRTCGVHVHHDIADYKSKHLNNLFNLFKKSEKALDSVLPTSRRANNNTFCRSLQNVDRADWNSTRYYKLNLLSYSRHGSIEFRGHSGSTEFKKISNWVILTQGLVERAKKVVKPAAGHSLTLYDVLQAAGLVHKARTDAAAAAVVSFFNQRKAALA